MGHDGRRSAGQRRAAKVGARQRRVAAAEAAREQHAQVVVERAGDPRFAQQERFPGGGRKVSWDSSRSPAGAELSAALARQFEAFRAKFGRDLRPDDPVFFDPDADVPTPMAPDQWHAKLDDLIDRADEIGVDAALLKAWRDLGYVVTEENRHLFSAADIEVWRDTVERYWADDAGDLDDDIELDYLVDLVADGLETTVARTVQERSPQPARDFATRLMPTDHPAVDNEEGESEEAALGVSTAFAVLAAWLAGVREDRDDDSDVAETVLVWVTTNLGTECADAARQATGILGAAPGAGVTVQELADTLQDDFVPALTWLAAGVVAEYGDADAHWLRRYDPNKSDGVER